MTNSQKDHGLEVVAWLVQFPGLSAFPTDSVLIMNEALIQGGTAEPLTTTSSASSLIEGLEGENHELLKDYRKQYKRADAAEATLLEMFDLLGGVDGAEGVREKILEMINVGKR